MLPFKSQPQQCHSRGLVRESVFAQGVTIRATSRPSYLRIYQSSALPASLVQSYALVTQPPVAPAQAPNADVISFITAELPPIEPSPIEAEAPPSPQPYSPPPSPQPCYPPTPPAQTLRDALPPSQLPVSHTISVAVLSPPLGGVEKLKSWKARQRKKKRRLMNYMPSKVLPRRARDHDEGKGKQ